MDRIDQKRYDFVVKEARLSFFLPWGVCFKLKISQGRHASIAFILHQIYDVSKFYVSIHWFPNDSGYHSKTRLLPFVLNNEVFLKSSLTLHNKTFKFCGTQVSLAADEVLRKF